MTNFYNSLLNDYSSEYMKEKISEFVYYKRIRQRFAKEGRIVRYTLLKNAERRIKK